MDIALLIVLIAISRLIYIQLWPSSQPTTVRRSAKNGFAVPSYRSVSIVCGSGACESAKALSEKRFLSSEAPMIPLPDCNSSTCTCKYVHYQDRRKQSRDRRAPAALGTELFTRTKREERRSESGRRRSDWGLA